MELKLNIDYQELLELVRQLPEHLRTQLKTELSNIKNENPVENSKENLAVVIRSMRANPMFEEIEHPLSWQRQQRNEWE